MSEVKVNKITPTADCGTVTLGDSGDTVAIPTGVTLTSAGSITNSGTITNTGTISGGTITGTIDGQVNWQTGSIKTTGFTATAGEGYFCNTTSSAFTVTLPASPSAGDFVGVKDYAGTAQTNNITIARNGSNIQGAANDFLINTENASVIFIYVDGTQGWLTTASSLPGDLTTPTYVTATGGTITTCGDFKVHVFTAPGTFCVSCGGNTLGSNTVDYFVVAGGGGGGGTNTCNYVGGGAGAGGFRVSNSLGIPAPTMSPLSNPTGLPVTAQAYPIAVGGGGPGGSGPAPGNPGTRGSNSIFSTITSTGGGAGRQGGSSAPYTCGPGGSGGSNTGDSCAGAGNTPPVSPPQGNNSGVGSPQPTVASGGGGGAGAVGGSGSPSSPYTAGSGGVGSFVSPSIAVSCAGTTGPVPSVRYFAGGGGGGAFPGHTAGSGGSGGGGNGATGPNNPGSAGAVNTGGGGGAGSNGPSGHTTGGNGGSGIVIIRYKFQN